MYRHVTTTVFSASDPATSRSTLDWIEEFLHISWVLRYAENGPPQDAVHTASTRSLLSAFMF